MRHPAVDDLPAPAPRVFIIGENVVVVAEGDVTPDGGDPSSAGCSTADLVVVDERFNQLDEVATQGSQSILQNYGLQISEFGSIAHLHDDVMRALHSGSCSQTPGKFE